MSGEGISMTTTGNKVMNFAEKEKELNPYYKYKTNKCKKCQKPISSITRSHTMMCVGCERKDLPKRDSA